MEAYPVDVSPILENLGESIDVSSTLPLGALDVGDEHFVAIEPIRFDVTLTNAGTGIVGMGQAAAKVTATCARCLCEFPTVIEGEVDAYFVQSGRTENIPEEQDVEEIDAEGFVDLAPAIMSAIVLEAPFAPLHAEDCAGLCSHCGADLNAEPCDCADRPDGTNPFSALGELLDTDSSADE